jgi:hypothetical protein
VTLRGNRAQAIFRDDRDRSFFLQELEVTARRYRWTWLAYCLMSNRRHRTYGHLFQERYGSVLVESDVHFAQLLRYVALNPVSAGLCTDPTEWRWSSHRSMLNSSREAAHARARVEMLLEAWGGPYGTRYAKLFDPGGTLATAFGAESPWTHRPPLHELVATATLDDAICAAREHGYRLAEIAAALGVHESTVSRKLRRRVRPAELSNKGVRPGS